MAQPASLLPTCFVISDKKSRASNQFSFVTGCCPVTSSNLAEGFSPTIIEGNLWEQDEELTWFVNAIRKKRTKEQLPIILVTTEREDEVVEKAGKNGINGFVHKPLTASDMRAALTPYLGDSAAA